MNICRTLCFRQLAAWIVIWAIVIHALLSALAVAAGPSDDSFSAPAFCGDKSGAPAKHHVPLSYPHCALCRGFAYSLVPGQSGFLLAPVLETQRSITVGSPRGWRGRRSCAARLSRAVLRRRLSPRNPKDPNSHRAVVWRAGQSVIGGY